MKIPILCGPTASGKSAFALQLAQKIGGEIISCDSAQIYRECDIVTAKPTRQERESVPHHLLDICNPNERFSAMLWAHAAAKTASEIVARGKIPVICGGTGFYLRALLQPENLAAPAPDETLRAHLETRLKGEGRAVLLDELREFEPEIAQKIGEGDDYRLVRALQIALQKARGDAILEAPQWNFETQIFALEWPRAELYRRIETRVDEMLRAGALEETRNLREKWGENAPALGAVGYKQLLPVLENPARLPEAVALWKQATRNYAKRQMTWFRHQTPAIWLDARCEISEILQQIQ